MEASLYLYHCSLLFSLLPSAFLHLPSHPIRLPWRTLPPSLRRRLTESPVLFTCVLSPITTHPPAPNSLACFSHLSLTMPSSYYHPAIQPPGNGSHSIHIAPDNLTGPAPLQYFHHKQLLLLGSYVASAFKISRGP